MGIFRFRILLDLWMEHHFWKKSSISDSLQCTLISLVFIAAHVAIERFFIAAPVAIERFTFLPQCSLTSCFPRPSPSLPSPFVACEGSETTYHILIPTVPTRDCLVPVPLASSRPVKVLGSKIFSTYPVTDPWSPLEGVYLVLVPFS